MYDFLTFQNFITPKVLILFYYIGVFFLPVLLWVYKEKVRFLYKAYRSKNKLKLLLYLFLVFLMMQLFWRMMFEMLIGYFDMHNYLYEMVKNKHN